jgi:hypothetical protein
LATPHREQWHLENTNMADFGNDIGVLQAWKMSRGEGVILAIVDSAVAPHRGLVPNHVRLFFFSFFFFLIKPENETDASFLKLWNQIAQLSSIYTPNAGETVQIGDEHGTLTAGLISAVPGSECGPGIAYKSKFFSVPMRPMPTVEQSILHEMDSLSRHSCITSIYVCPWTVVSEYDQHFIPVTNEITESGMLQGVTTGRFGRGNIFLFSGLNEKHASHEENCSYDSFRSSFYTIIASGVTRKNDRMQMWSFCPSYLFATYSDVYSTRGRHGCKVISGYSGATGVAGGLIALLLSA